MRSSTRLILQLCAFALTLPVSAATDLLGHEPLVWMTFDNSDLSNEGTKNLGAFSGTASPAYVDAVRPFFPDSKAGRFGGSFTPYTPNNLAIPITGFTFTAYCTLGTASWGDVISFGPGGSGNEGWRLERRSSNGLYAFYNIFKNDVSLSSSAASGDTQYHFYALSIDENRLGTLYCDGVFVGRAPIQDSLSVVNGFQLGRNFGGGNHPATDADIDDFRIYGQALTSHEIRTLFNELQVAYRWQGASGSAEAPENWGEEANWEKALDTAPLPQRTGGGNTYLPLLIENAYVLAGEDFSFEGYDPTMILRNAHVTLKKVAKLQSGPYGSWIVVDADSSLVFDNTGGGSLSTGSNSEPFFDVIPENGVRFTQLTKFNGSRTANYTLHNRGSVAYEGGLQLTSGTYTHNLSFTIPVMDETAQLRTVSSPRTLVGWGSGSHVSTQNIAAGLVTLADGRPISASAIDLTGEIDPIEVNLLPVGSYTLYKNETGIHVVYVEPMAVTEYTADLAPAGSSVGWSGISWDNGAVWANNPDSVATLRNAAPDQTLVFDEPVVAGRVIVTGTGPVSVAASGSGVLSGLLDLSGVTDGPAAISAPLAVFPWFPPSGISTLIGNNTFASAVHASGTLLIPTSLGALETLTLAGGGLEIGQGVDTTLNLAVSQNSKINLPMDLTWQGAITGSASLIKTGLGTLTFEDPKTPGGIQIQEGSLVLNALTDAGANGLFASASPMTFAPDTRLTLKGINAGGSSATGLISLGTNACMVVEGSEVLRRPIRLGQQAALQVAEGAALTFSDTTLSVTTLPHVGVIGKTPDREEQPTITLRGTVTLYCGDDAQWGATLRVDAKLLAEDTTTGNLTKSGVANVALTYGTPGGDASSVGTIRNTGGTLILSDGCIIAREFIATDWTATTVMPQRNLYQANLTAERFTFNGPNCRLEIPANAKLTPGKYTLVRWTGDTTPGLPRMLPTNLPADWVIELDADRKAIIMRYTKPFGTKLILY